MGFGKLARVYDEVIGAMDYEAWTNDILFLINTYSTNKKPLILDVGCGTGGHLLILEKKGYECVGVDASKDMIEKAKEKGVKAELFVQDITKLNLENKDFDAVMCVYDVLNNLESIKDVEKAFRNVYDHLKTEGVFVFDIITIKAMKGMKNYSVQAGHTKKGDSYIWENDYKDKVWTWTFTTFIENNRGGYDKFVEKHKEKHYGLEQIKKILERVGFVFLEANDAYTLQHVTNKTDRINVVARRK
ncbi:class I SAM-dependent methyltransferase [Candidatus Woesearchaeota archaeon]|nr:class I SAM-dependent methyltransferase [Candidatus Woesearchaeota archaeon]